jgi:RNA polymerase sigma-70 factor (ECF subfamily)
MAAVAEQHQAAEHRLPSAISADLLDEQGSEEELSEFAQPWVPCTDDPRAQILALYDEYRPRLFRYLCSMHLGRETAEEVIQETFMRLTAALLKKTEIDNVQGWIVRVAHNLAVDTHKRISAGAISGEEVSYLLANRADPALNPEEAYVKKEKATQISIALATLKPQHRECFQMRAHGFRYKTIGQTLGISEQRAAFVVKQVAVRLAALCG